MRAQNTDAPPLFDEMARFATGAIGALAGLRRQMRSEVRQHLNQFLAQMDFVPRDDFERVEAVAIAAREAQLALQKRVEALEKQLSPKAKAPPKAAAAKPTPKKPAAQKTAAKAKTTTRKKA